MSWATTLPNGVGIGEISPPLVETCTIRSESPRSSIYNREPSVATTNLDTPSRVSCVVFSTLGGGGDELSQTNAARTTITVKIAAAQSQLNLRAATGGVAASTFPEEVSRRRRFKSAHNSAALWKRTSRSFSRAF